MNSGHACKVCNKKGWIKCVTCEGKGMRKCGLCAGKRRRLAPCPECVGHGTARDPLARTIDASTCPWCNDARRRDCAACDAEGKTEAMCLTCLGKGTRICSTCVGTTERGCNKCSGTGDLSSYLGGKSSNRCDKCKAKGVLKCTTCKKGRVECAPCKGSGRLESSCPLCLRYREAPCRGCIGGSEDAWVMTAERLFAAKRFPEAKAHIDVALERAEARIDGLVLHFVGTAKEAKTFRKPLHAELKRLRKRGATIAKRAKG